MFNSKSKPYRIAIGLFLYSFFAFVSTASSAKTLIFQQQSTVEPDRPVDIEEQSSLPAQSANTGSGNAAAANNSQMFFMLEELQQEIRMLRGQLEEQANQIQVLQQSSKARYKDLDARILNLSKQQAEGAAKAADSAGTSAAVVPVQGVSGGDAVDGAPTKSEVVAVVPSSAEQRRDYQSAYALIQEKKFDEAVDALYQFIEKYPEGDLTGNAYYWLGELYLALRQLDQAKQAFLVVERTFPSHAKVPDALYKLGVTFDLLQDADKSESYLKLVQQKFPQSTAAKLALDYKIER